MEHAPAGLLDDDLGVPLPHRSWGSRAPVILFEDARATAVLTTLAASPTMRERVARGRRAAYGDDPAAGYGLDAYDARCWHILLVDRDGRSVAGMRLAYGSDLLPVHGLRSIRAARYWELGDAMLARLVDGVELGRIWVAPAYQRHLWSVALLWKALAQLHELRPFGALIGMVALRGFPAASSAAIVHYLGRFHAETEARVRARQPALPDDVPLDAAAEAGTVGQSASQTVALRALVSHLREHSPDHPLPALLRHYIRMGATFPGFARDPDHRSKLMILVLLEGAALQRQKERFQAL